MEQFPEKRAKELEKKYAVEMYYYENLLKKIDEEMKTIKEGGKIEETLRILAEKSVIIGNIDTIEKQIKPLKEEYMFARDYNGYSSRELEKILLKLSFLLQELINTQARNAKLLEASMGKMRERIDNVRKGVSLINAYKNRRPENLYLREVK
jgi:hypothetical protein